MDTRSEHAVFSGIRTPGGLCRPRPTDCLATGAAVRRCRVIFTPAELPSAKLFDQVGRPVRLLDRIVQQPDLLGQFIRFFLQLGSLQHGNDLDLRVPGPLRGLGGGVQDIAVGALLDPQNVLLRDQLRQRPAVNFISAVR